MTLITQIPEQWDKQLLQAAIDARYLLAYFARIKVTIVKERRDEFNKSLAIVSDFLERQQDGRSNSIKDFWEAFIILSDIAYPATVESIRYYFHYYYSSNGVYSDERIRSPNDMAGLQNSKYSRTLTHRKSLILNWSGFFRGEKFFGFITFIALIMTVLLSLLAYIGSTALAAYERDYGHWRDVQSIAMWNAENLNLELETEDNSQDLLVMIKGPNPPQKPLRIPRERAERLSRLFRPVEEVKKVDMTFACNVMKFDPKYMSSENQPQTDKRFALCMDYFRAVDPYVIATADDLSYTLARISSEQTTLQSVHAITTFPVVAFYNIIVKPTQWILNKIAETDSSPAPESPVLPTNSNPGNQDFRSFAFLMLMQQQGIPIPDILPPYVSNVISLAVETKLTVLIINNYILTLSFGLLGACVRVLRQMTESLGNFTLAPSLFPRYRARILLGMVAGPTIGLLFDSNGHLLAFSAGSPQGTATITTELSLLAIAFVAGFSIEILFSILDRMIRIVQEFAGIDTVQTSSQAIKH